jgi:two-component sensor histidine kinase
MLWPKELHHRIGNNLQLVLNRLRMQSEIIGEPSARAGMQESRQRLFAMALIHKCLYSGRQVNQIEFGEYARILIDELSYAYAPTGKVRVGLNGSSVALNFDQAISCGLILNELVTNAFKYAYPDADGEILVEMTETGHNRVTLTVADHGIGLPPGFDLSHSKTMGMSIVDALTQELDGSLRIESSGGAKFSVTFLREVKVAANASAA